MQDIYDISVSTIAAGGLAALGLALGTGTTTSTFQTKYDTHRNDRHTWTVAIHHQNVDVKPDSHVCFRNFFLPSLWYWNAYNIIHLMHINNYAHVSSCVLLRICTGHSYPYLSGYFTGTG